MKKQVVIIHGGDTFESHKDYVKYLMEFEIDLDDMMKKGWKNSLTKELGEGFEIIRPRMPCHQNAKYDEWKLWFEKFFQIIEDEVILVGHSLGGIFLAKYLSENNFPNKILATFLLAPPYDEDGNKYSLASFSLGSSLDGL